MPISWLDLSDTHRVADYLDEGLAYALSDERERHVPVLNALENGEDVSEEDRSVAVLNVAQLAWPRRRAVEEFIDASGAEEEWDELLDAVRPTTAFLLSRLRRGSNVTGVSRVLLSPMAEYALRPDEEREIAYLRPWIRIRLWHLHAESLRHRERAARALFDSSVERFAALRTRAELMSPASAGEWLRRISEDERAFYLL